MSKKNNIKPMYFSYLEVENIKCFGGRQVLDLKNRNGEISQWTLILGNNGLGKTTLLKCLAWMDTVEETDKARKDKAGISGKKIAVKPTLDGLENDGEYEQLTRIGKNVVSSVKAQLTIGTALGRVPKKSEKLEYSITIKTVNGKLEMVDPQITGVTEFNAPYIYGYSASRHMEIKNLDRTELVEPISNLFSESGELYDASEQLLNQEYTALKEKSKGKETALFDKIKKLLVDLLPEIRTTDAIITDAKDRLVKIKTSDGEVPLNNLSLGYKTMIAWIVDLALKMLSQNPDSDNPLEEPAIVIIDEVDLHLHPKWQREIQEKLVNTFKKTQFICTAHSPFMAQSSESENLCVLNRIGDEVVIENEPHIVKGWRIGQIVTSELFNLPSDRGPEAERMINDRRDIIDKDQLKSKDKSDLNRLNQKIEALPVLDTDNEAILLQIRDAAELLKKKGIIK